MKQKISTHDFLVKSLCYIESERKKMCDLLHTKKLFESKVCFFSHISNILGMCRGVRVQSHVSYAEACNIETTSFILVFVLCHYYALCFVFSKMNAQLIINKPVTYILKILI